MKLLRYLLPATLSLLIATNVGSQDLNLDLKGKAKGKISSFKDAKIHAYTQQFTDSINSFIKNNFRQLDIHTFRFYLLIRIRNILSAENHENQTLTKFNWRTTS